MLSGSEAGTLGRVGVAWRRWLTLTALLLALLFGSVHAAEERPEPIEVGVARTAVSTAEEPIRILTTKFRSAEEVAEAMYQVLPRLREGLRPGPHNVLVIEVEDLPPGFAGVVEELLKRFDVPEETFQLRIRLIRGVRERGAALPEELADIAGLLRSVFKFEQYLLQDDSVTVARTGSRTSMRLAGGLGELEFLARYEPPPEGRTNEGGSFAFDQFALTTLRTEEREDGSKYEKPVPFLTTSFRARSNAPLVVGACGDGKDMSTGLIFVLTVTPANELVQPFLTLDLSTPEATVRSFTKAAATGNVGLAQACFVPGGVDYEDVREVLGADPSQASKHGFRMVIRAIDPDGPITVVSRKGTSEDEMSITWRVTFKSAVSFTEGGKEVTFKPGDTLDLDASLKKVGDRWLIDNF